MNLVNGLALHEFSVAQVDRALARCLGGHSFEFCPGLRLFFSLSHPRDMLIISFSHWLFIAKQCNILLESCSRNSFSNMVVVLSIYCCRNLAFLLRSKTIFSVQINAYASLL